jgi:hypothetical protein
VGTDPRAALRQPRLRLACDSLEEVGDHLAEELRALEQQSATIQSLAKHPRISSSLNLIAKCQSCIYGIRGLSGTIVAGPRKAFLPRAGERFIQSGSMPAPSAAHLR